MAINEYEANTFAFSLNEASKSWCSGFENSDAGGHIRAAGGSFPAKYFAEFKKRLGIL